MSSLTLSAPDSVTLLGNFALSVQNPCVVVATTPRFTISLETKSGKDIELPSACPPVFTKVSALAKEAFDLTKQTQIAVTTLPKAIPTEVFVPMLLKGLSLLSAMKLSKQRLFTMAIQLLAELPEKNLSLEKTAAAIWGGVVHCLFKGQPGMLTAIPLPTTTLPLTAVKVSEKRNNSIFKTISTLQKKHPKEMKALFAEQSRLVEQGVVQLGKGKWKQCGETLSKEHKLMQDMELSTDSLRRTCVEVVLGGAWGAKGVWSEQGEYMVVVGSPRKMLRLPASTGEMLLLEKKGIVKEVSSV